MADVSLKTRLLAELDDVLRTMPPRDEFGRRESHTIAWMGRALAALSRWDSAEATLWGNTAADDVLSDYMDKSAKGYSTLLRLIHQARAHLQMEVGPTSVVVGQGQVFDYFNELRQIIEPATQETFFVDPYLDAEFVSRFLPHVPGGVSVRLLGGKRIDTLLPAVDLFAKQSGLRIEVRASKNLHDRFLFTDRAACYVSGASFKDGAKNAPVTVTQIIDACQPILNVYETLWQAATVERRP